MSMADPEPALTKSIFAFATGFLTLAFTAALAEPPQIRLDRLMAAQPIYSDPQERAAALPRLLALWQQAADCAAKDRSDDIGLTECVARLDQACLEGLGEPAISSSQRACWSDEALVWAFQRQEARRALLAAIEASAAAMPEFYPTSDPDVSLRQIRADFDAFDKAIDRAEEASCRAEVAMQGIDPGRGTPPLMAIDSSFTCTLPWEARAAGQYRDWMRWF